MEYNSNLVPLFTHNREYRESKGLEKVVELLATAIEAESRMPEDIQIVMDAVVRFLGHRIRTAPEIIIEEARSGHLLVKELPKLAKKSIFEKMKSGTTAVLNRFLERNEPKPASEDINTWKLSMYDSLGQCLARKMLKKVASILVVQRERASSPDHSPDSESRRDGAPKAAERNEKFPPSEMEKIPIFHRVPYSQQPNKPQFPDRASESSALQPRDGSSSERHDDR